MPETARKTLETAAALKTLPLPFGQPVTWGKAASVDVSTPAASGAPMWTGTVLGRHASGDEDAYAIGLDGYVWTYRVDSDTKRAGRLMCTWLKAHTFALTSSTRGRAMVVGAHHSALAYVQQTGDSNIWWTRPVPLKLPAGMAQCQSIDNIRARWSLGSLYVGVDTRHVGTGGECLVQQWESVWECHGMNVQPMPWRLRSTGISTAGVTPAAH